jgi:HD-GYP domain-containing protein (c-di-GMP phosphodiesterase class II)
MPTFPKPLHTLLGVLEMRFPEKKVDSQRVADLAVCIWQRLALSLSDLERLRFWALLHDIGIVGIPDNILTKPAPLTEEEWSIMQQHTAIGANLVALNPNVSGIAFVPRQIGRAHV